MSTVSRSMGGRDFYMEISATEMEKLENCVNNKLGDSVEVTHKGDIVEEVHCVWLLGVMCRFNDSRKIMDSVGETDEQTRVEMLRFAQQLFSSEEEEDEQMQDDLRQAFLGGKKCWQIPIDDLFEEYEPEVVRECVEIGFTISKESLDNNDMDVTVTPQAHDVAITFALATRHIEWKTDDMTPFNSHSDFCPADVQLIQQLLRSKLQIPTTRSSPHHWIGHLFWTAATEVGVTDSQFKNVVNSNAFWEYISDRQVPKLELLVKEEGKPIRYKTRLDRIIKNFVEEDSTEELEQERILILINSVAEHVKTKPSVAVDQLFHDYEGSSIEKLITFLSPPSKTPLKTPFESAAESASSLQKLSNDTKLKIYSLYKQAIEGDNTRKQPGMFDFEGKAKWNAWNSVKGMSKEEASDTYIQLINHLMPH